MSIGSARTPGKPNPNPSIARPTKCIHGFLMRLSAVEGLRRVTTASSRLLVVLLAGRGRDSTGQLIDSRNGHRLHSCGGCGAGEKVSASYGAIRTPTIELTGTEGTTSSLSRAVIRA